MTKYYSTRELADASRTTLRTIRFWESQGLFSAVERDRLGERQFTEAHLQRARVIAAASMAGMSLDAIKSASTPGLAHEIEKGANFMVRVLDQIDKDFGL